MPGPVGKRSDAKHGHRTKAEIGDVDKVAGGADVVWAAPPEEWHEIARDWYLSLQVSGQAVFYEQSDVATAFYLAEMISRSLAGDRVNGQLFGSIMSAMGDLVVTEGSRRRVKIELQREAGDGDSEVDDEIMKLSQMFK